jgi:two-component system, chemotaxis family, response regulator Rcp1
MAADIIMHKQRPAQVMLIEDNNGDVILTRRALKEAKISNQLTVAMSGEEAITMLNKEGEYADVMTPDLILLDLNLPKMHGQEVLRIIKDSVGTKHIPVIILSSSRAEQDVVRSYNLHANGYVVKPLNLNSFKEVVEKIEKFWFTLVVLPDAHDVASNS